MKKVQVVLITVLIFSISLICLAAETADPKEEREPVEVKEAKDTKEEVITNSIGMKLRLIEPGEFMMGSDKGGEWITDEKPVHKVKITKAFYIGVCEVTQEEYEKIMGKNPSSFKGAKLPVNCVGWKEAQEFCRKLSEKENAEYFLPTEAQWEYACRAGSKTEYYWGDKMDNEYCWYTGTSEKKTHEVGTKKPNKFGLYDMSGNVYEICRDWYDEDYYKNSPEEDPQGPEKGTGKSVRGGCWAAREVYCRSAVRGGIDQRTDMERIGFRICRAVSEDKVITNSIGMKLRLIEPGEFMMGSEKGDNNEKPVHKVKISKPFYIGVYEVTQAQYEKIMGTNRSEFSSADRPVECVSWNDAREFCKKLSEKEGVAYRLPTEAEWEYACRAGTKTEYYWGDTMDGRYAVYTENSGGKTQKVGTKEPNKWGLYDMSGNVWEWCEDLYGNRYSGSEEADPKGATKGEYRVLRGGSWCLNAENCRSAYRYSFVPTLRGDYLDFGCYFGFRVCRSASREKSD